MGGLVRILDVGRLPAEYTGFFWGRDPDGTAFRIGYLKDGHLEGPEFVWDADGVAAQWSRAPLLPWAESTYHGPRWRWYRDGSPAHEALFEHYLCLRQRAFTPSGEPRPTRRYALPDTWHLWSARQSPVRDVAYWDDGGVLGYAPLHDPGPLKPLPRDLLEPERARPEALVRALAPITRRAVFLPTRRVRDHLEALEAAVDAHPGDLEAWSVLADAQAEAGHPLGPSAASIVAILRANDVERALETAQRLAPVEDWPRVLAERAWANGDAEGVTRAAATLGVRLPTEAQREIERLADRANLRVADALGLLAGLGRPPRLVGRVEGAPTVPATRKKAYTQWVATVLERDELELTVRIRPAGDTEPPAPPESTDDRVHISLVAPPERPSVAPLAVPESVLSRYRRFVPQGSAGRVVGRW